MPKKNKEQIQITVEMLSDWHIGSGTGRTGDIDHLIKRDLHGLPYIPAKTLTGIWRDACELVAQGLDENEEQGQWQKWVNYIFGDQPANPNRPPELSINQPRHAALSIRAAHFPKPLSDAINSKDKKTSQQLKEAITFIKPGIKIDIVSGCAQKDCLRLEEQVRKGAILTADCTLEMPDNEAEKQTVYALLSAGAAMIERLGGNRRRGSGQCRFSLSGIPEDLNAWVQWIEQHPHPPNIPEPDLEDKFSGEILNPQSSENWVFIPLKIILHSSLVISKRTVGNIVETLDYIPGTHLLRLITRKLGNLGIKLTDAITKGNLLVTNATLEINNERGEPIPFALFYEKLEGGFKEQKEGKGLEKEGSIYNRLIENEPKDVQLKGYRSGYISQPDSNIQPNYAKVTLTLGTHNTIEDQYQCCTSNVGGVYSYEAIKAGTILRAEIRLHQEIAETLTQENANWWQEIEGWDSIGQSKKDDYGNIEIQVLHEPQPFTRTVASNDQLYVWLLSDLLIRNEQLRPTVAIEDLAKALSDKLGGEEVKLTLADSKKTDNLTLISRQNRLDSWQVRWGLSRPSLVGLGAGTCIIFNLTQKQQLDLKKLEEIEASGIGERTAEGYGQLCFNHPLLTQPFSKFQSHQRVANRESNTNETNTNNNIITPKNLAFDYARLIETAAWREEIQRQATAIASQADQRVERLGITITEQESQPSMSQLGSLRTQISRLRTFEDSTKVSNWIDHVLAKPNRSEKWNKGSLKKIKDLVTNTQINFKGIGELNVLDSLKTLQLTQNNLLDINRDLLERLNNSWQKWIVNNLQEA